MAVLPQVPLEDPDAPPPLPGGANNKPSVSATGGLPGQSGIAKQIRQNINPLLQQHVTDRLSAKPGDLSATTRRELADFEERSKQVRAEEELKLQRLGVLRNAGAPLRALPELTGQLERARLDILARGEERRGQAFQGGLALSGQAAGELFTEAGLSGSIFGQDTIAQQQQNIANDNAALQRAISQGNVTGIFTDPVTGESQDTLQKRIADAQQSLAEGVATGSFGGQKTVEQQRVDIDNLNSAIDRARAEGDATGVYIDPDTGERIETLQSQLQTAQITRGEGELAELIRSNQKQEELAGLSAALDRARVSGTLTDPETGMDVPTLEAEMARAQQELDNFIQRGDLTIRNREVAVRESQQEVNALNAAMVRAVQAGDATGNFVDPVTQMTQQTLQAELGRKQAALATSQQQLQEGMAVGRIGDRPTLDKLRLDEATRAAEAGEAISADQVAELTRSNLAGERLQSGELTGSFTHWDPVTQKWVNTTTLESLKQDFQQIIDMGNLTGAATFIDAAGEEITKDTMAAKLLAFEKMTAAGVVDIDPITGLPSATTMQTLQANAQTLQDDIERGKLSLQEKAQQFGQNITEAEVTGYYNKMGGRTAEFFASMDSFLGDEKYNGEFDFNADGQVNSLDWGDFQKIVDGGGVTTQGAQALQSQLLNDTLTRSLETAGATGNFQYKDADGNTVTVQTREELDRLFAQDIEAAQLFGESPPLTFSFNNLLDITGGADATPENPGAPIVKGEDSRFDAAFDINQDGQIDFSDRLVFQDMMQAPERNRIRAILRGGTPFQSLSLEDQDIAFANGMGQEVSPGVVQTIPAAVATDEETRIDFLGGDPATGAYVYRPEGSQTLAAQQLGVQEAQVGEAARQFNKVHGNEIAQFKSQMSGYMVDENGNAEFINVWNEETGQYEQRQATTTERQQFDLQMDQIENLLLNDEPAGSFRIFSEEGRLTRELIFTREEALEKGWIDENGATTRPPNWPADAKISVQPLSGIEAFAINMGLEFDADNPLNNEQQFALVQSVMSLMFQPVNPTFGPRGPGGAAQAAAIIGAIVPDINIGIGG